jgi:hypothetical protein
MRGQKIFNELIRESGLENRTRKGRSNTLLHKRNECLMARYIYYGYIRNKCYEEIVRLLVGEFYLSPVTISALIQEHTEQLQLLKQKAHSLYYFQNRWPHMKW